METKVVVSITMREEASRLGRVGESLQQVVVVDNKTNFSCESDSNPNFSSPEPEPEPIERRVFTKKAKISREMAERWLSMYGRSTIDTYILWYHTYNNLWNTSEIFEV